MKIVKRKIVLPASLTGRLVLQNMPRLSYLSSASSVNVQLHCSSGNLCLVQYVSPHDVTHILFTSLPQVDAQNNLSLGPVCSKTGSRIGKVTSPWHQNDHLDLAMLSRKMTPKCIQSCLWWAGARPNLLSKQPWQFLQSSTYRRPDYSNCKRY